MSGQLYALTVTAVGEVRDKDGNLVSSEPVEFTQVITEDEYASIQRGME